MFWKKYLYDIFACDSSCQFQLGESKRSFAFRLIASYEVVYDLAITIRACLLQLRHITEYSVCSRLNRFVDWLSDASVYRENTFHVILFASFLTHLVIRNVEIYILPLNTGFKLTIVLNRIQMSWFGNVKIIKARIVRIKWIWISINKNTLFFAFICYCFVSMY